MYVITIVFRHPSVPYIASAYFLYYISCIGEIIIDILYIKIYKMYVNINEYSAYMYEFIILRRSIGAVYKLCLFFILHVFYRGSYHRNFIYVYTQLYEY